MPILNDILPQHLSPFVRNVINGLVIFHILAFLLYCYFLARSFTRKPNDDFKDQYKKLQKNVENENARKKAALNKQE